MEYAEFSWTYSAVRSVVWIVAECGPADRSMVMVTSRGRRSTLVAVVAGGAAPAHPDAVDGDVEPVRLELRVGDADGREHPAPVGSSPWMAHLSRFDRATERPTVTASRTLAAPITSIAIALVAPSASHDELAGEVAQTSVTSR